MSFQLRFSLGLVIEILLANAAGAIAEDKFGEVLKLDHFKFYNVEPVETKADASPKGQFDRDNVPAKLPAITAFAYLS